jgi:LmbE family N-acetylglucosaminyl deacetylase
MDHAVASTGCLPGSEAPGARVLGVFAHPDDETVCAGGLLARYAARGAETMVVSATRGEAGQIRDENVGSRQTIAAVREAELRQASARLGVTQVRCLDYRDGTLADADFAGLVGDVAQVVREFRPDVVISFGPDGGYGHPDHIAISAATTAACEQASGVGCSTGGPALLRPVSLYHRHFPPSDMLLMNRLATWLTDRPSRFAGTPAFVHALVVMAQEAGTMGNIRDHTEVRWFPPGSYVVEQGEPGTQLFLILSGTADVWHEDDGGRRVQLRQIGPGEFFGELGVANNEPRSANVVAAQSLTCLVFSPTAPTSYEGRGEGALVASLREAESPTRGGHPSGGTIVEIDVSDQIRAKVEALCAYRSQFPVEPNMFPDFLLQEIFGREHFIHVALGNQAP